MGRNGSPGFALVELLLALTLAGIVALAIQRVLVAGTRFFAEHALRVEVGHNLRTAMSLVTAELRELNPAGGDLIEMASSSVTYRAMRHASFVCGPADLATRKVPVALDPQLGLRAVEPGRDSVLILSMGRGEAAEGEAWQSAAVDSVAHVPCPSGAPGWLLTLSGVDAAVLGGVPVGAPVRGYQVTRLRSYEDATGVVWLGLSEWRAESGWSVTQPIIGPLEGLEGFRLEYLDADGQLTGDPSHVRLVNISLALAGSRRVSRRGGSHAPRDSLRSAVSFRNGPRE